MSKTLLTEKIFFKVCIQIVFSLVHSVFIFVNMRIRGPTIYVWLHFTVNPCNRSLAANH